MGTWYWIGVSVGIGAAAGVVVAGWMGAFFGLGREWPRVAPMLIGGLLGIGLVLVLAVWEPGTWADRIGGAVGSLVALRGATTIVFGAMRRGGTRVGTGILVTGAALVIGGFALIPAVGFLEAVAIPALAIRLHRRQPERYAGLRTLAKD